MILFSVLAAVGACVGLTLLDAFYDSIIKWLSKIGEVAQRVVKGVLIGCKTFLSDVRKNIGKEISKNYSKVGDRWQVTEVSREIPASAPPAAPPARPAPEARAPLDPTEDIEAQLLSNYQ